MARKDAVSKQSRTGLEDWLRNMENCTVYRGHARFESAHEVSIGGERLHADKIFINVGGRALVPDMPGLREIDWLTNSSMMSVDVLPRHLIVAGGSYIGLEFGQMFRRFGAEVTVIEMGPRLVGREDEDVSTAIREIVEQEGVRVRVNAKCISFAKRGTRSSPTSIVPRVRRECTARRRAGYRILAEGVPSITDVSSGHTSITVGVLTAGR
jgi:pyruvate/2-oxoglutarate dehydrogenase complex dihydrolipoamide dehydrogenase (E3) component